MRLAPTLALAALVALTALASTAHAATPSERRVRLAQRLDAIVAADRAPT